MTIEQHHPTMAIETSSGIRPNTAGCPQNQFIHSQAGTGGYIPAASRNAGIKGQTVDQQQQQQMLRPKSINNFQACSINK